MKRRFFSFHSFLAACCLLSPASLARAQFIEYKITASDGGANDRFGEYVSIDGTTAVVGAFRDDDAGTDAGAAYIFDFADGVWSQTAKIIPDDSPLQPGHFNNGHFGSVLDIHNDVIVVGALDTRENGVVRGAAYVFEKNELGAWNLQTRLIAFDGASNDKFGGSVATNGAYVFVGALDDDHSNLINAGSVYVYRRITSGETDVAWELSQKITPSDARAGDGFGWSIDATENTLLIGARNDDDQFDDAGAAYVYTLQGNEWVETSKIHASNAGAQDYFGEIVAIKGDQAIVGARLEDTLGDEAGAAYIFERQPDDTWLETAKLLASDGESLDRFGTSATIEEDFAVVSTRIDNDLSGAIYVFQKIGDFWTEISKLTPDNLQPGDLFGQAVNISGTMVISGTKGDDDKGSEAGAAHIFDLSSANRGALVALYNATKGANWLQKNNWLTNAPLGTWYGVTTDGDGNVTELNLDNNNLTGVLPSALGGLNHLKKLTLRQNNLTGKIPDGIGELSVLEELDLGQNGLVSDLPAGLAKLSALKNLFLDENAFTGAIPVTIAQLPVLEILYLNDNAFSGAVPELLGDVETLREIHLEANQLSELPEFTANLNNLVVFDNEFTFEDLEPNINVNGFEYIPQAKVGEARNLVITENNPLLLQILVGGSQNVYQWKKNGSVISNADSDTFIIPSASTSDAGVYTLEVTSELVPGLTISSEPITVSVTPVVNLSANLSSINVVPPLLSPAGGSVQATLIGSKLTVLGEFDQLTSPFGAAFLHVGAPGVNTDPAIELTVTMNNGQGVIGENDNQFDLNTDQLIALQNGLIYVSIETESGSIADPLAPELRGHLYTSPNSPPNSAVITAPDNGSDVNLGNPGNIEIKWNPVSDPDGHPVSYLWAFSRNQGFEQNTALVEGIFPTSSATSFSISHENIDAFLASQGVAQGEAVTIYHLVASSDGSLYSTSNVFSINLIRSTVNQAPRVNNPIADFTYVLEEGDGEISLPTVFLDPDGDALTYSAESSNTDVAETSIVEESLIITPLGLGTTTITVNAIDTFDAEATDVFELTINSRPQIVSVIEDQILLESDEPFQASLAGLFSDVDPLEYSASSENTAVVTAEILNDGLTLQISPVSTGIANVTVTAKDSQGASNSFDIQVSVQSEFIMPPQSVSESINIAFGNPDLSSSYRLVALPGNVNVPLASAISGTPGTDWIAYMDNGQDVDDRSVYFDRYDGSTDFTFKPGGGFWLLSKSAWQRSDSRSTVSLAADRSYAIPLQSGWNIISNPFDIDVPWQAVAQLNGISQQLYKWEGSYTASNVFSSARSGNAFYYFNAENLSDLKIPYIPATSSNTVSTKTPALEILVISAGDTLSVVRAGRHQLAEAGPDSFDQIAPPAAFQSTGLRFIRKDAPADSRQRFLKEEFLPSSSPGFRYDLTLQAPVEEPLILKTSGYQNFEDLQEIYLFDRKLAKRYDLRKNPSLIFWPDSQKQDFILLIGDDAYIEAEEAGILPEEAALLPNYPNPFAKSTTIEFSIPEPSRVRVVVYDALGRQVRMLADGDYDAGHHMIRWNAESDAGTPLSSGMYFCRLQLQETQIVRSMIIRR